MAGYGPAGAVGRGYWTRLHARAFYLRDDQGLPVVLVSSDLFAIPGGLHAQVAQLVNAQGVYLPPENLVITATHTHHGPGNYASSAVYNGFASFHPRFDPKLFAWLSKRIAAAVVAAAGSAREAHLEIRTGHAIGIQRNRSVVPFLENTESGDIIKASLAAGTTCPGDAASCPAYRATDPTLTTITLWSEGCPIGQLNFYAVHPTAIPPTAALFTADLFGVASHRLEARDRPPACGSRPRVAGFFNGAEGDISADWHTRGRDDAVRLGTALSDAVTRLEKGAGEQVTVLESPRLDVAHTTVPRTEPGFAAEPMFGVAALGGAIDGYTRLHQLGWHAGVRLDEPEGEHGYKAPGLDKPLPDLADDFYLPQWLQWGISVLPITRLAAPARDFPKALPLTLFRIGDALTLAMVPAELTTVMGRRLRDALGDTRDDGSVVVVGLANEYYSYVATAAEYDLQFYEGASTILGPHEGTTIVSLLESLSTAPRVPPASPGRAVRAKKFHAGQKTNRFGPDLVDQRVLLLEDLEPFLPEPLRHAAPSLPRFAWHEAICGDWTASEREVAIQRRLPGGGYQAVDTDAEFNLLTIMREPGKEPVSESEHCGTNESTKKRRRTWAAVWLDVQHRPSEAYRFRVTRPGLHQVCSEDFDLDSLAAHGAVVPQGLC